MKQRLSTFLTSAVCATALTLAACASLPEPPATTVLYDFGAAQPAAAPAQAQSASSASQPAQASSLLLARVAASGLPVDSQTMLYRLAYADDLQLRGYQSARWSQPVQRLFEQQLRQQLEASRVVLDQDYSPVRLGDAKGTPPMLHADIERFEQVFTDAAASQAVARVRVTVVQTSGASDKVLGQRVFERTAVAPTADAAGGAQALAGAARQIAAEIDVWLNQLP